MGRGGLDVYGDFGTGSPHAVKGVLGCCPQTLFRLIGGLVVFSPSKSPQVGAVGLGCFRVNSGLKAHHAGDCAQIRIEIRVEGRIVVVDGAIGIFEAVSR